MSRKSKAAEFIGQGYNITVTGRSVHVTEAMKNYIQEKLSKIERFTHKILDVNVTMDIQKIEHRVDIVLKMDHLTIKSQAATTDMYASIDQAVSKLESQLLKYRDRIRDHQAKGVPAIDMNVNVLRTREEEELLDVNGEIEEENQRRLFNRYHHEIVDQETMPLKILSSEEAVMKMELSGDPFLIFRNEEDMKLRVIYRREDDNFGIIEPEV